MARVAGWVLVLIVGLVGAALSVALLALFMPIAPSLATMAVAPLVVAGLLAAYAGRLPAQLARTSRRRASLVAAILAVLPLGGLYAAILASPALPIAPPPPDPRGAPKIVASPSGARIAYWVIEPQTRTHATPVVFIHGGPGSMVRPRDFALGQPLRDAGFRTIFFDQAGSSASSDQPIGGYTVANAVADIEAVRRAVGAKRIVPWGESWGASLAALYTRAHPDRVAGAIIESPGDFPGEAYPMDSSRSDSKGDFAPNLRQAALFVLIDRAPQLAEGWMTQSDARGVAQHMANSSPKVFGVQCKGAPPLDRPLSPPGGSLYPQLRLQHALADAGTMPAQLSQAPTLVIRPACDFISPETSARYRKAYPNGKLVDVPGTGHGLFGNDDVYRAILRSEAVPLLASVD